MDSLGRYSTAVQDFKRARARAGLQAALSRLGGPSNRLLSFEKVRKLIGESQTLPRGLQDIPINSIVGSVGRYEDFNRQFLPRRESQVGRWANVRIAADQQGLPPIEVYKIGEAYFVLDGHHRVSVARELRAKYIEAYVTEIPTNVRISPTDKPEEMILKAERAKLLEDSGLVDSHPEAELRLTLPGRYAELRDHITVHQYFMGLEEKREVSFQGAAEDWLVNVYQPAVSEIRRLDLLRDFPNRTETDIYLWLMKHRTELVNKLGWEVGTEETAAHLWNRLYTKPRRLWERTRRNLSRVLPLKGVSPGPLPTEWRLSRGEMQEGELLFRRILVPISGEDTSWRAVDQAILVARCERSELRGVHVLVNGETADRDKVKGIRQEFERRLQDAQLKGSLVLEKGNISRQVEERSHWSDLVVLHLKHPPGDQPMQRLLSGLRGFLQRSPRPAIVLSHASDMDHALLAYDGSRKAHEALYLAAYLACSWGTKITVFTGLETSLRERLLLQKAKGYLISQEVEADYVQRRGPAGKALIELAAERGADFILMGGYGRRQLLDVMMGSTLDTVLRAYQGPVWICN